MTNQLPAPVKAYFAAATPAAIADCFTPDATVTDERRTHRGRAEILAWREGVAAIDFRNLPGDMTFTNPQACSGPQVSDMPYFELTARYADGDKTVRWYQGCNYPGMHDFVDRLQDFYEMDRLIIPARG